MHSGRLCFIHPQNGIHVNRRKWPPLKPVLTSRRLNYHLTIGCIANHVNLRPILQKNRNPLMHNCTITDEHYFRLPFRSGMPGLRDWGYLAEKEFFG